MPANVINQSWVFPAVPPGCGGSLPSQHPIGVPWLWKPKQSTQRDSGRSLVHGRKLFVTVKHLLRWACTNRYMGFNTGVTAWNPKTCATEEVKAQNVTIFCMIGVCQPVTETYTGDVWDIPSQAIATTIYWVKKRTSLKISGYPILTNEF